LLPVCFLNDHKIPYFHPNRRLALKIKKQHNHLENRNLTRVYFLYKILVPKLHLVTHLHAKLYFAGNGVPKFNLGTRKMTWQMQALQVEVRSIILFGCMTRHTKIALIVALVFILITTPIGLLSWNSPTLSSTAQLLTLPAFPVVYGLVQVFPPPMGESEISSWDYMMLSVGILVSALVWGLVAGLLSRYSRAKPKDAA